VTHECPPVAHCDESVTQAVRRMVRDGNREAHRLTLRERAALAMLHALTVRESHLYEYGDVAEREDAKRVGRAVRLADLLVAKLDPPPLAPGRAIGLDDQEGE
jgi:hypothetical protein